MLQDTNNLFIRRPERNRLQRIGPGLAFDHAPRYQQSLHQKARKKQTSENWPWLGVRPCSKIPTISSSEGPKETDFRELALAWRSTMLQDTNNLFIRRPERNRLQRIGPGLA